MIPWGQDVGWSDRPIYRHTSHSEYLFYLQSRSKGLWMIGPKVKLDGRKISIYLPCFRLVTSMEALRLPMTTSVPRTLDRVSGGSLTARPGRRIRSCK